MRNIILVRTRYILFWVKQYLTFFTLYYFMISLKRQTHHINLIFLQSYLISSSSFELPRERSFGHRTHFRCVGHWFVSWSEEKLLQEPRVDGVPVSLMHSFPNKMWRRSWSCPRPASCAICGGHHPASIVHKVLSSIIFITSYNSRAHSPRLRLKHSPTISSFHAPFSLLGSHPNLFFVKWSATGSINHFSCPPTGQRPLHSPIFPSFCIVKPLETTPINPFMHSYFRTHVFGILYILLIPRKP